MKFINQTKILSVHWVLAICCLLFTTGILGQGIGVHSTKPIAKAVLEADQASVPYAPYTLFTDEGQLTKRFERNEVLVQSTLAEINSKNLKALVAERPAAIQMSVPFLNMQIPLKLIRVETLAEGFQTTTSDGREVPYQPGVFYRGIIANDAGSVVALSFFEDEVIGMISNEEQGNITINKLDADGQYLIYSDKDLMADNPNFCSATEPEGYAEKVQQYLEEYIETRDVRCIKVYIECDYALYQNKGSVSAVNNWISAVFNNVATLYANENIVTQLQSTMVWTTPDNYNKNSSTTALTQFRNARPTFNGDIAHLAALGGNNIGGVAWLDVLCTSYDYAYSNIQSSYQNVPTYSWTVEVMTHEMGHNLGSPHTQSCSWVGGALDNCYTTEGGCPAGPPPTNGGTIMSYCHLTSYGINFNNGFGAQPGNLIRSRVNNASCLGMCSDGSSCNAPNGLAISNIGQTTATASWSAVSGATAYQFEYRVAGGSWITLSPQSSTTVNLTGLTSNTTYETHVRSVCGSTNSSYSTSVNFTTGSGASCGTPSGLAGSNITTTTMTISWNAVSGAINYTLDYKLASSSTWSSYTATSTAVNFTGMTAGTAYNFRVRANCNGSSGSYSATITVTTQSSGATYCTSRGNSTSYEWIDLVKLRSINNPSTSNGGYANFTNLSTNLTRGTSNTLTVSAGFSSGSYRQYWTVWIDYNQDGDFLDSGEKVRTFTTNNANNYNTNFTVPSSAPTGPTRMRVQMKYGSYSSSCETFAYGEVEDYTVNIVSSGGLPGPLSPGISNVTAFPNPFSDQVYLAFDAGEQTNTEISVTDVSGKVLVKREMVAETGNNVIRLEQLVDVPPGIFIVQVKTDKSAQQVKIVKLPSRN